jgi:two-component system OmpR family response regulator
MGTYCTFALWEQPMRTGVGDRVRALVVDSNDEDLRQISQTLERMGLRVTSVPDGRGALERLRDNPYELLMVDVHLDGAVEGLRVAEAVRWRWPRASVILTTDRPSLETAVRGIDAGIDGYLIKPASPQAIEEKAVAALERQRQRCSGGTERDLLRQAGLTLDKRRRTVTRNGETVNLTPTEFGMLRHLMENASRVIPTEELVEVARGRNRANGEAAEIARWHIHNLRHKIEADATHPRYIVNVHGAGYSFGKRGFRTN